MYRLLDPGTKFALWIASDPDPYYSASSKLFNLLCYRCLGRQSTFEYLYEQRENIWLLPVDMEDEQEELCEWLREYRDVQKKPVFSTAYMVPSFDWAPGPTKVEKIVWQWVRMGRPVARALPAPQQGD